MSDDFNSADEPDLADEADGNTISAATARTVLEYLVRSMVDDPDAVSIDVDDRRRGAVRLDVTVGPGDMGRVIGRHGRTAQAIRTVVRAAATRDDVNVDVEFVD